MNGRKGKITALGMRCDPLGATLVAEGRSTEWPSTDSSPYNSGWRVRTAGESRPCKGTTGRCQPPRRVQRKDSIHPRPDWAESQEFGDRWPKAIFSLSRHPRRSRRETPGRKDDCEFSGSQPGCGFTGRPPGSAYSSRRAPADLPARRVEPGSGGLLQPLGCRRPESRVARRSGCVSLGLCKTA
jgi:hypothetical protein